MNETELYHHGVKGMKWGVRKSKLAKMTKEQQKAARDRFYKAHMKEITKTSWASVIGGPVGQLIVQSIRVKKLGQIPIETVERGKREVEKYTKHKR